MKLFKFGEMKQIQIQPNVSLRHKGLEPKNRIDVQKRRRRQKSVNGPSFLLSGPEFLIDVTIDGRGCPREPDRGHSQFFQPLPRQEVGGKKEGPQPRRSLVGGRVHPGHFF